MTRYTLFVIALLLVLMALELVRIRQALERAWPRPADIEAAERVKE